MNNDLISRSALLGKSMSIGLCDADGTYYGGDEVVLADDIKAAPAVDAVEVVRCKACIHYDGINACKCHAADDNGTPIFVRDNDFCSYGERKTE